MPVTEEHPGKICGRVLAGIFEGLFEKNPSFSVTIDTMVAPGLVHATGEGKSWKYVERPGIVRQTLLGIGYESSSPGFGEQYSGVSSSVGTSLGNEVFSPAAARKRF